MTIFDVSFFKINEILIMSKIVKDSFETKLKRLEEIIDSLDKGDEAIDKMLDLYEEGTTLANELKQFINQAELRIINIGQSKIK
jgi:exodeoxyribonuclease VII small subunit